MSKILVVYYSATGHVHEMAGAVERGAMDAGAEVRMRRAAEVDSGLAPYDSPTHYLHGSR